MYRRELRPRGALFFQKKTAADRNYRNCHTILHSLNGHFLSIFYAPGTVWALKRH